MGDNLEDPFEDIDSGDEEIGRPPTPDFHHGGEEVEERSPGGSEYSDASGDEGQKKAVEGTETPEEHVHPVTGGKTLPTAEDVDVEVDDNKEQSESVASPVSSVSSENKDSKEAEDKMDMDKDVSDNEASLEKEEDDEKSSETADKSPQSDVENDEEQNKSDLEIDEEQNKSDVEIDEEQNKSDDENDEEQNKSDVEIDEEQNKSDENKEEQKKSDNENNEEQKKSDNKSLAEKEQEGDLEESNDLNPGVEADKEDEKQQGTEEEDDDIEMPMSPIGDLGLTGKETAIVDDIMKSDVTDMLTGPEKKEDDSMHDNDKEDDKNDDDVEKDDEGGEKDDENDDDDDEKDHDENKEKKKRHRQVISDDEDEDDEEAGPSQAPEDKDDEGSEPEEAGDQLIADIFGASDEEEEFEGFDQEDIEVTKKKKGVLDSTKSAMISDEEDEGPGETDVTKTMVVPKPEDDKGESSDSDVEDRSGAPVWDFDVMIEKKKASRAKRRRRGDGDLISDNDDLVIEMLKQMKQAADEDKLLNEARQAATKKLKLFPLILKHLNKADLQLTFIDSGALGILKEWLSPLPDGSMPHLQIRTGLLKILTSFPALDSGALKMSGLGRAVMYIYRHPKETRENRQLAGKLINDWARPIFGVTSNFKSMSREEREERDYQNMSKRRRLSSTDAEGGRTPRSIDSAIQGAKKALRPGDKGFVMRARVPMPSNKDYVVRPKTDVDSSDFSRTPKTKTLSRADKQMRKFKENSKSKKAQKAVTVSIEGRKMNL